MQKQHAASALTLWTVLQLHSWCPRGSTTDSQHQHPQKCRTPDKHAPHRTATVAVTVQRPCFAARQPAVWRVNSSSSLVKSTDSWRAATWPKCTDLRGVGKHQGENCHRCLILKSPCQQVCSTHSQPWTPSTFCSQDGELDSPTGKLKQAMARFSFSKRAPQIFTYHQRNRRNSRDERPWSRRVARHTRRTWALPFTLLSVSSVLSLVRQVRVEPKHFFCPEKQLRRIDEGP